MKLNYVDFSNACSTVAIGMIVIATFCILGIIAYEEGKAFLIFVGLAVGSIAAFFGLAFVVHVVTNYFHPQAILDRRALKQKKEEDKAHRVKVKEFEEIWE